MPQGKKKGSLPRNNKKKRGAGHGKNAHRKPNTQRGPTANKNRQNLPLTPENALTNDVPPDYKAFEQNHEAPLHESYPTIYSRYKAATNRVFQYMQDNSPESIHSNRMNVNSLVTAADWMEENQHQVQPGILKDLKLAIRVRSRVAESVFEGGDSGHKHLLATLVYCWRVLESLPRASISITKNLEMEAEEKMSLSEDVNITASINRFAALVDEDSGEETDMEEEIFPSKPVPRPEPQPEPLSLEEILKSDLRHDSWLFLDSLDELMRVAHVQYHVIFKKVVQNKQMGTHGTSSVEDLIEASVAVNMAIQQVQRLEMEFALQRPDLATPYQLLTTFAHPETLLKTREILRDHARKPCSEKDVRLFLSECMEHNFRAPSDPKSKRSVLVSEFCQRYQSEEGKQIIAVEGFFGPKWKPGRARTIHEDLDELLMADILPKWFLLCRDGILGKIDLPRQNELAPFWVCMKSFFKSPLEPVRWSTAFAVHAMLTAIYETEGVMDDILLYSELSFDRYFAQLTKASMIKLLEAENIETPVIKENMAISRYLENFGLPVFNNRAIWNPLAGGTLLTYVAFFGNLEVGCTLIDDRMQLRMTLHLYNALIVSNILKRGEIPLLDALYEAFEKCRAIWPMGKPPSKGKFVEHFWLSVGAHLSSVREMRDEAKDVIQTVSSKHSDHPVPEHLSVMKSLKPRPIEPSEISTSFRRICHRDFHDVVDNYHTPEQRKRGRRNDGYALAVQTNDTLDAIDNEQMLLALNLCACGTWLDRFICEFSAIFQWDSALAALLDHELGTGLDKRQGVIYMFAQNLLGALDFAKDPLEMTIYRVPQGKTAYTVMKKISAAIPPDETVWFQAIEETGPVQIYS